MASNLEQLLPKLNAAFGSGDLKFLEAHITDDVEWHIPGQHNPITGKEQFLSACSSPSPLQGQMTITIRTILVDGNKAAMEFVIEGVTKERKPYCQHGCDIYHFRDDKVYRRTSYLDTAYDKELLGC